MSFSICSNFCVARGPSLISLSLDSADASVSDVVVGRISSSSSSSDASVSEVEVCKIPSS